MKLYKKILYTTGVTLLLGNTALVAANTSAKSIMKNAFKYVEHMDKYAFDAVIVDEVKDDDGVTMYRNDVSIKVDRPQRLRVDRRQDGKNKTYYIDDGQFSMIDHSFRFYAQVKTPKNLDKALDFLFKKYDINAPLSSLIYSSMKKRTQFKRSKNFGLRMLNGIECNYVAFKDRDREIHVWIATGSKPLVQAYTIIDTALADNPKTNTIITWKNDTKIVDSDFIFKAPEDATKISIDSKN